MGNCLQVKPPPEMEEPDPNAQPLKDKELPVLWIVGGPGSGKATQVSKILASTGYTHINMDNLIQEEIDLGTEKGLKLKKYLDEGKDIPDRVALTMVVKAMLSRMDTAKGFIMDGFPMNSYQAHMYQKEVYPETGIIYLETTPDTMKMRLLERGRPEDTDEKIEKRIKKFKKTELGVTKMDKKKMVTINADMEQDEVFEKVKLAIEEFLA